MKTRLTRLAAILMTAGAMTACGDDDPTGIEGEASGEVTAQVYDGSSSSQAALSSAQSSYSGTMTANAHVEIYSEARGWVALSSPSSTSIDLQSNSETTVASRARVDADSYSRVRLVLDDARATVFAGATIESSILDADVTITVGGSDGSVTIEKTVTPFTVSANAQATLRFDLNSEMWIDSQSTQSRTTSDAEVSSAASVLVTS